jgi:hypothetical protein
MLSFIVECLPFVVQRWIILGANHASELEDLVLCLPQPPIPNVSLLATGMTSIIELLNISTCIIIMSVRTEYEIAVLIS